MFLFDRKNLTSIFSAALIAGFLVGTPVAAQSQENTGAVDGYNLSVNLSGGSLDGVNSAMLVGSLSTPIPYFTRFGFQLDLALGKYDGVSGTDSGGAAGHLFWRDPQIGMLGIFADFGNINAIHFGRLGFEGARYYGPWTIEVLLGMEFGQNVLTRFVDEVDISYNFNENFKVSVGQRLTSRGHMANIGFEKQFAAYENVSWSIYGVAEAGEDDFNQAFLGVKASYGSAGAKSLQERDRSQGVKVRLPRNLASITQCGKVDTPFRDPQWLYDIALVSQLNTKNCASKSEINALSSTGIFKP